MLTLRAGASSLVLAPEIGGSVLGWSIGESPLLRRADALAVARGDVRGMGCFPLVPYANRIALGRFAWDGKQYQLDRNFGDHPHSIHGIGWQRGWTVERVGSPDMTMTLAHTPAHPGDWPFPFAAEQSFALSEDALRISLHIQNLHTGPAPVGLGLHPFFPRPPDASLRFAATSVWLNDATALPKNSVPIPAEWDHREGRPIGSAILDNCFNGWDRVACLDLGPISVTIEASEAFTHLQVYTPPGRDFFCVEPVTHRPDTLNDPAGPCMHVLAPREFLSGIVTIRVVPKPVA